MKKKMKCGGDQVGSDLRGWHTCLIQHVMQVELRMIRKKWVSAIIYADINGKGYVSPSVPYNFD